ASRLMMCHYIFGFLFLSAAVAAQDCGGNTSLGCLDATECASFGAGVTCEKANPTDFLGCCKVPTTTTTTAASVTSPSRCVDLLNPMTGVSDCPARSYLCRNTVYLQLMRQQCPLTCRYCTNSQTTTASSACVDLKNPFTGVSDCPGLRSYCNNAVYNSLMRVQCRATCGFC
ncbi:hypothetical protein PMAYCL1PPCAC_17251, partial [Pristionchus mayeri]